MKVAVSSLAEGQVWTAPLLFNDNSIFLPAGVSLRKKDLSRLAVLELEELNTKGRLKTDDDDIDDDELENQEAGEGEGFAIRLSSAQVIQVIKEIVRQTNEIFAIIDKNSGPGGNPYSGAALRKLWSSTTSIINIAKRNKAGVLESAISLFSEEDSLAKSAVVTAIFSILIANQLKLDKQKTTEITAAAILHDIGMLRLPKSIVEKKAALSPAELKLIQGHPTLSFKIIHKELLYPKIVADIALQHHERWDGSGYPYGLSGEDILKEAQIISVADTFDAMLTEKPYRNSLAAYNAMKILVSENQTHFSPEILKAFVNIMGIYPIGSGVLLSDGRLAKVTRYNSSAPLRPTIQIISVDGVKPQENGEKIDLLKDKKLFITQAVNIKNLMKK